ncbi:MAG: hemolysin family protein [Candidatus Omnitrophica bacterium]|nr:hemolysin family protein [Candidatus Omnitrophota bacterium]MBU4140400.1 hemolysin family protein [Candidatus Omnitrophota bacterium]
MNLLWHILALAVLLILSGLFSATETALFSLSKIQLRRLKEARPAQSALIAQLLDSPRRTLNTILTGNMLVNVTISALVTETVMCASGQRGLGASVGLATFLLLVFGEVTPKTFAISHAESFSCFISRPLYLFSKIVSPVCLGWSKIADFFSGRTIGRQYLRQPFLTSEEIRGLVSIGEKGGVISKEEEQMISTVFDFRERYVNEIMTPRVDIVAIDVQEDSLQLEKALKSSRHSKIPVYKDSVDNILGIIYAKEYLLAPCADWQSKVLPVLFAPETKRIEELLLEFQSKKSYAAIVTDEYGGTSGLVTIEDILEEIVGEIQDEYDTEEKLIVRVDENTVSVSGKTSLYDLNEELNAHFKAKGAETLGGFMIHLFGRIPKSGESIRYRAYLFSVDDVRKHRIRKVTIRKK